MRAVFGLGPKQAGLGFDIEQIVVAPIAHELGRGVAAGKNLVQKLPADRDAIIIGAIARYGAIRQAANSGPDGQHNHADHQQEGQREEDPVFHERGALSQFGGGTR